MATSRAAARRATLPSTMKAAAIDRFGPPEVTTLHTLPVPRPAAHEVLITLYGAGVGVWEAEIRDGSWQSAGRAKFPRVLGTDGAGLVVAMGLRGFDGSSYTEPMAT